jgi:hypothetical protein
VAGIAVATRAARRADDPGRGVERSPGGRDRGAASSQLNRGRCFLVLARGDQWVSCAAFRR